MFGYLVASPQLLTEEELSRYKAAYCGLCRCLKERYGQFFRLTLNYDLTFLILLLNSLYEPDELSGVSPCPAHPFDKRKWWKSEITEYAADMNVALSFLKCQDDWKDDSKPSAGIASGILKKSFLSLKEKYPRQCKAMEEGIQALSSIERTGKDDPDGASAAFGFLMGQIFVYKDDRWQNILYNLGDNLGRYIYLLDAVIDLDKDIKKGAYNPFSSFSQCEDKEERFREILKMFLGEAARALKMLPLVTDADILNNILACGLWTSFDNKFHPLTKEQIRELRKQEAEGK